MSQFFGRFGDTTQTAIYCLIGVADKHDIDFFVRLHNFGEDRILQCIGILKFIHMNTAYDNDEIFSAINGCSDNNVSDSSRIISKSISFVAPQTFAIGSFYY